MSETDLPKRPEPSRDVRALIDITAALRHPVHGCPWDIDQTSETIARYVIEEAYEVVDAIERSDQDDLRDELGDLLLQVVFHARMAEEQGRFDFGSVVQAITTKLIRRHPHVFGDRRGLDRADVRRLWDEIKGEEKRERSLRGSHPNGVRDASVLADVPRAFPALSRADKLARKAASVGFTWPDAPAVLQKVDEELQEVKEAIESDHTPAISEEIGDLLFTVANLARQLDIDPEAALSAANRKFERRFRGVETALSAQGRTPEDATLSEMEDLWVGAKKAERAGGS